MMDIITKLVYQQNQILLEQVAKKYGLNEMRLKQMYLTPTFYKINIWELNNMPKRTKRSDSPKAEVEMKEEPRRTARVTKRVNYGPEKRAVSKKEIKEAVMEEAPKVFSPLGMMKVPDEYWKPRRMSGSKSSSRSKKSASSGKTASPGSASPKVMEKRVKKMLDGVTAELGAMGIEYYDFSKLPKIKRNPNFLEAYAKIMTYYKEHVKQVAQKINGKSGLIDTVYSTIQGDLKLWLNTLKASRITKRDFDTLRSLIEEVDAGELAEKFEAVKLKMATLFKLEYDALADLKSSQLAKQQEHLHDDDQRLYAYFTQRVEDVDALMKDLVQQRSKYMMEFTGVAAMVENAVTLMVYAIEFVDKYDEAVTEFESSKEEKTKEMDDLLALFGKL